MNMRIPILKLNDILIVSIQWELDDQDGNSISRGFIE